MAIIEIINNLIKIIFRSETILRRYQVLYCSNLILNGKSLELGASENNKNFFTFVKGKSIFDLSNNFKNKKLNIFKADLTKKINIKSHTYNNILIFNVLEHLPNYDNAISEINRILKKGGSIIGSTPFIYQIHGAPKDYYRFSKDFFYYYLKKNKFRKIEIKCLGFGPFLASYSLIHAYLRFLPIISHAILLICYLIDFFIQLFVKTDLAEIFPIGFIFKAKK